jgi:hypothetical protein
MPTLSVLAEDKVSLISPPGFRDLIPAPEMVIWDMEGPRTGDGLGRVFSVLIATKPSPRTKPQDSLKYILIIMPLICRNSFYFILIILYSLYLEYDSPKTDSPPPLFHPHYPRAPYSSPLQEM